MVARETVDEISTRHPARPRPHWSQPGDPAPIDGYDNIFARLDPAQQSPGVVAQLARGYLDHAPIVAHLLRRTGGSSRLGRRAARRTARTTASSLVGRSTTGSYQVDSMDPVDDCVDATARQQRGSDSLDDSHHLAGRRDDEHRHSVAASNRSPGLSLHGSRRLRFGLIPSLQSNYQRRFPVMAQRSSVPPSRKGIARSRRGSTWI